MQYHGCEDGSLRPSSHAILAVACCPHSVFIALTSFGWKLKPPNLNLIGCAVSWKRRSGAIWKLPDSCSRCDMKRLKYYEIHPEKDDIRWNIRWE
jgi:hypothetical protein